MVRSLIFIQQVWTNSFSLLYLNIPPPSHIASDQLALSYSYYTPNDVNFLYLFTCQWLNSPSRLHYPAQAKFLTIASISTQTFFRGTYSIVLLTLLDSLYNRWSFPLNECHSIISHPSPAFYVKGALTLNLQCWFINRLHPPCPRSIVIIQTSHFRTVVSVTSANLTN